MSYSILLQFQTYMDRDSNPLPGFEYRNDPLLQL